MPNDAQPLADRPLAARRILITGGAGAVGRAVAIQMWAAGANILLADWNEVQLLDVTPGSVVEGRKTSILSSPTFPRRKGLVECLAVSINFLAGWIFWSHARESGRVL